MEIKPGEVVSLKKRHPCGGSEWRVVRIGADVGLECLKCGHYVVLKRGTFERRVRGPVSGGG